MKTLRARFRAVAVMVMAVFALALASQVYAFAAPSATASPPCFELLLADLPVLRAAAQLALERECAQTHTYLESSAGGLVAWRSGDARGAQLIRATNATPESHPLIE